MFAFLNKGFVYTKIIILKLILRFFYRYLGLKLILKYFFLLSLGYPYYGYGGYGGYGHYH